MAVRKKGKSSIKVATMRRAPFLQTTAIALRNAQSASQLTVSHTRRGLRGAGEPAQFQYTPIEATYNGVKATATMPCCCLCSQCPSLFCPALLPYIPIEAKNDT